MGLQKGDTGYVSTFLFPPTSLPGPWELKAIGGEQRWPLQTKKGTYDSSELEILLWTAGWRHLSTHASHTGLSA